MVVGGRRKALCFAIWSSRHHYRDFFFKIEGLFRNRRTLTEGLPCFDDFSFGRLLFGKTDSRLAAAVVSAARAFDEELSSKGLCRALQVRLRMDGTKFANRELVLRKPALLQNTVLNTLHYGDAGTQGRKFLRGLKAGDGNLLDFKRDYIGTARQICRGAGIIPSAFKAGVYNKARRARWIRVHDLHAIPERARRHRRHTAKLSTAENSNC